MRILVVEDDPLLAAGLARVLNRCGHAVDRAAAGIQADNLLRSASYELVVLDIGLPDIDGFEVLRRLRLRRVRTNVLVLTARDAVQDRDRRRQNTHGARVRIPVGSGKCLTETGARKASGDDCCPS